MDIPVCKPRFGARLSRCLFVHLMLALILGDKTMRSFETTDVPAACHGDVIHIYIYKKQYQKCSVYHSLSKVSHIKVFPMLLLKKSLYGFGHVFSVRTPHDRPRTQFDHSSCLRFFFIYDILCVSVSTKKLHQSAHVCHVWTVDTANQQIHSISVMCFFTWLICLGFPGTVCPNSYGNKTKYHVSHGKRSMWSIRNSAVLKTSLGADAMCGAGGLLWMCHWVRWWSY